MADHDAQAATTATLPSEYQKCLEELTDVLEHLKADDLSADTVALLLSDLTLNLPDDAYLSATVAAIGNGAAFSKANANRALSGS